MEVGVPFRFDVNPDARFAYIQASGVVTDGELLSAFRSAYEDAGFGDGIRILLDTREVVRVDVTTGGVGRLVDLSESLGPSASLAAVLTDDPVVRGMTRMYELRRGQTPGRCEIALFQDLTKALVWLDVPVLILVQLAANRG